MLAPCLMVQGTASSVGKSLMVTALCRYFSRKGIRVAPFKSQNMALNSAVTFDGLEIGRAQAVQAEAAGALASVEMNPILLKPEGDSRSQVVVMGKPVGSMSAMDYHAHKTHLKGVIEDCLKRLRSTYELVIIEGAGSPAEINLKDRDIVNMHVAKAADAPVLLVGDIDRGGVFAAFVGTMELLEPDERERVAAFLINKFRGDAALLTPGLDYLTGRTGKPVLGVIPYVSKLRIADEDSVSLENRAGRKRPGADRLDIVVVRFPRISNYDDMEPLEHEPGVVVRFEDQPEDVNDADLVILPGSKNTCADLDWLRGSGIAEALHERVRKGDPIVGLCGGCQMLGEVIEDPYGVEGPAAQVQGLGLLPLRTCFVREKMTAQVRARIKERSFLSESVPPGQDLSGYEIHMGMVERTSPGSSPFEIIGRNGRGENLADGAVNDAGNIIGTMIHGIFENNSVRKSLLDWLRRRKGISNPPHEPHGIPSKQGEYDRLMETVRAHIDEDLLWRISGLPQGGRR